MTTKYTKDNRVQLTFLEFDDYITKTEPTEKTTKAYRTKNKDIYGVLATITYPNGIKLVQYAEVRKDNWQIPEFPSEHGLTLYKNCFGIDPDDMFFRRRYYSAERIDIYGVQLIADENDSDFKAGAVIPSTDFATYDGWHDRVEKAFDQVHDFADEALNQAVALASSTPKAKTQEK